MAAHFANLGSKCVPLNAVERLRILHDFYRPGDEAAFSFDMNRKARLGHDFRDYICPDSVERTADHIKLGEKYARVLFLKDYASYIKDSMFSELTELNRNLIEGNSGDSCRVNQYPVGHYEILGYGVPNP